MSLLAFNEGLREEAFAQSSGAQMSPSLWSILEEELCNTSGPALQNTLEISKQR
jgi:hypothetical protein